MYSKKMTFIILVLLSSISLFMFTSTAVAASIKGTPTGSLSGTYIGVANGTAFFALCGFDDQGFARNGINDETGLWEIIQLTGEARWTFRPNGTGTFEELHHGISMPNNNANASNPPGFLLPWFADETGKGEFTYTFDQKTGSIEITHLHSELEWITGPLKGVTLTDDTKYIIAHGVASSDRKTIPMAAVVHPLEAGVVLPICENRSAIVTHLNAVLVKQDQAPELVP